jgi:glucose-1-phosphate thymidylyltransferase
MIYYPLSTLMLAGIREILVISTPHDLPRFRSCSATAAVGASLSYAEQPRRRAWRRPSSSARLRRRRPSCLILGDNLFYGHGLTRALRSAPPRARGRTVFGYYVKDPERYGVAEFDADGRVLSASRRSRPAAEVNYAVTGSTSTTTQVSTSPPR